MPRFPQVKANVRAACAGLTARSCDRGRARRTPELARSAGRVLSAHPARNRSSGCWSRPKTEGEPEACASIAALVQTRARLRLRLEIGRVSRGLRTYSRAWPQRPARQAHSTPGTESEEPRMCGIIGYVGRRPAKELLITGPASASSSAATTLPASPSRGRTGLEVRPRGRQPRSLKAGGRPERLERDDRPRPHALGHPRPA